MYGMSQLGEDVFIFVTYHKAENKDEEKEYVDGKPDYADEFVDNVIFRWDSQIDKKLDGALEILNLEERTLEELKGKEEVVEGTITIGCGEFAAVETLAKICKTYKEKYPLVQIVLHTATADTVYESKWNNKKSGRDDCRGSKSRFTSGGSGFGNTVKEFREWVKSL